MGYIVLLNNSDKQLNYKTKPPGHPAVFNIILNKYLIKEAEIVRNIKQQRADVVIDLK